MAREDTDQVLLYRREGACFAKFDIGAYGWPAVIEGTATFSMLAGDPILQVGGSQERNRAEDLSRIATAFSASQEDALLGTATGAFCGAHYTESSGTLALIADKLAVRPLYYFESSDYVVFASALRILEGIAEVPKRMDIQGVTEISVFGFPQAARTPFRDVRLVDAGQVLYITPSTSKAVRYWSWDSIPEQSGTEDDHASRIYEAFSSAVERRLGSDRTVVAFISGGLDSRSVIGELHKRGVRLHTVNFALAEEQDYVLAKSLAESLGTIHQSASDLQMLRPISMRLSRLLAESEEFKRVPPEHIRLVWGGEGGSVGLGHVHVAPVLVEHMRAGRVDEAIREYLRREDFRVTGIVRDQSKWEENCISAIREHLLALPCKDPGRSFYLFLMLTDQKRHLASHYEEIDRHKVEMHIPFYDSEFLSVVISTPLDFFLRHRIYNKMLRFFPDAIARVPWQAYPGHEPCPVPPPPGLSYQWDPKYTKKLLDLEKHGRIKRGTALLKGGAFPDALLDRTKFSVALLAYKTGVRDYAYLVHVAEIYSRYWSICEGSS